MKPTEDLKNKALAALKMDIDDAKEWLDVWKQIPIFEDGRTSITALADGKKITSFDKRESEDGGKIFTINFQSEPTADHGDTFFACFNTANEAEIFSEVYLSCPTKHINSVYKDFFGFRGTWEEVTKKIIEVNNFLTQPAPPLEFELKQ